MLGGREWIREPRTEKQSTGLFFPACGRAVLFSSHSLTPQNKIPRRETTGDLLGGREWIREPRTEKQSTGLFFPACGRAVLFSSHSLTPQNKIPRRETTGDLLGGREWIRTTEVVDGRFTVCSLWPLGNSPICTFGYPPIYRRCMPASGNVQFDSGVEASGRTEPRYARFPCSVNVASQQYCPRASSPFRLCIRGGAGGRTRTPDLLITNQLLYQLSYTSIFNARIS